MSKNIITKSLLSLNLFNYFQQRISKSCAIWANTCINAQNYDKNIIILFVLRIYSSLSCLLLSCTFYAVLCTRSLIQDCDVFKKCPHMFVYFIYVKPMNRMVLGNKQYNTYNMYIKIKRLNKEHKYGLEIFCVL